MFGKISLWAAGAVVAGLMLPSQAMAQYDVHTSADLNLRVGPGTEYGIIDVIPAGYPVDVLGCLDAYEWCDIEWDGLRGWVFARFLVQPGTTVYLPQYAPRIGVPIISFSFGTYHDRYYRDRPWYRERHGHWRGRDYREQRIREERTEERRDTRRERAEERDDQRRDTREEVREERRDTREEVREERRENRQERQERLRQQQETEQRQQQRQQQRQEAAQPRQRQQADKPRQGQQTEKRKKRRQAEKQGQSIRQPE